MAYTFCSRCGEKINDDELFCPNCGKPNTSAGSAPTASEKKSESGMPLNDQFAQAPENDDKNSNAG